MSDTQVRGSMFDQVCAILNIEKQDDETPDEFKVRAVKEFNTFPEEDWNEIDEGLRNWISDTSDVMSRNIGKKRVRTLPGLPGLDKTLRRIDPNSPPTPQKKTQGRKRIKGEDSITRVMTVMASLERPENAKVEEVRQLVNERFNVVYSDSAIKQSLVAFNTAREVLGLSVEPARVAAAE